MADFKFSNEEIKKVYEAKYNYLKSIAEEKVDDTDYLWNKTVHKYAVKMEKVKKILQTEGIN